MWNNIEFLIWGMAFGWMIGLCTALPVEYKAGQIDCINGNIKYELVTQPNGEMKWEEKK